MALTKTTVAVNNIQSLADTPSSADGLTTATFKAKFDKTGSDLKDYINYTLTTEIDTALSLKATASDYLSKAGNLSGLANTTTARTNLGLGSIATRNVTVSTSDPSGGADGDIWIKYS